jgi:hypothetical protein
MYAGPPGFGTAVFLRMPEGDQIGDYPVVAAAEEFPEAPAALIAVQVFNEPDAFGFQAYHGSFELTELGEEASGHFACTLREISIDILAHFVGVFEDIPVRHLDAEYCQTLADSAFTSDSTSSEG